MDTAIPTRQVAPAAFRLSVIRQCLEGFQI